MIIGRNRFNIYLLLSCAALLAGGCHSTKPTKEAEKKKEKPISTLRLHLEMTSSSMDLSIRVPVNRQPLVTLTVDKDAFLTEANVKNATVIEVLGGFDLEVEFDHHGSLLLEQYTTSNPGRRYAIFSQFGETIGESRWLGAPTVSHRIINGKIQFTPDASRAETERLVLGLNNVAKKNLEKSQW